MMKLSSIKLELTAPQQDPLAETSVARGPNSKNAAPSSCREVEHQGRAVAYRDCSPRSTACERSRSVVLQ